MPYHKNKQQAFQAAQQGYEQAIQSSSMLESGSHEYGSRLKSFNEQKDEALMQIENAMETASEHQKEELEKLRSELHAISDQHS
ncbi:hypothetical protein ACFQPF_03465 [Fictibacillus iocasae]|uniref:Small, acid-soluble spore protein N n=1 Tax=Fictibacillus iocasae TaxID=2715437 RepID=A0ABW2NM83_9BACL